MIELRSDTFTLPTAEMLRAIATAPLGDDAYREDATVLRLEALAASRLGKAAACLMPSGTMANLASVLSHCAERGRPAALVGDQSDIWVYEDASVARWAGVAYRPVPTRADGTLPLDEIARLCESASGTVPAVLCLENPHNLCGGVVLGMDYLQQAAALVRARDIAVHLDGARLFNAAIRLRVDASVIARAADSVQVCLSKGLAAPIGSVVAGPAAFIEGVRRTRRLLGGDMHQAGIIAAAGIVALERMVDRLEADHRHARRLAEGLAALSGIALDRDSVQTNTVVFRVTDARFSCRTFIEALDARGVRVSEFRHGRLRAVTHHAVTAADVERVLEAVGRVLLDDMPIAAPRPIDEGTIARALPIS